MSIYKMHKNQEPIELMEVDDIYVCMYDGCGAIDVVLSCGHFWYSKCLIEHLKSIESRDDCMCGVALGSVGHDRLKAALAEEMEREEWLKMNGDC